MHAYQLSYFSVCNFICIDAGASEIKLIGVSGFDMENSHHKGMQELLNILLKKGISISSLTPSSFAIKEQSIYAI